MSGSAKVRYSAGSWLGLVRGRCLVALPADASEETAAVTWDLLAGTPGVEQLLATVLSGRLDLTGLPSFAIVAFRQDGDVHAILRGDLTLRMTATDGSTTDLIGSGVSTWNERMLTDVSGFELLIDGTAPNQENLPLEAGAVRLAGLQADLLPLAEGAVESVDAVGTPEEASEEASGEAPASVDGPAVAQAAAPAAAVPAAAVAAADVAPEAAEPAAPEDEPEAAEPAVAAADEPEPADVAEDEPESGGEAAEDEADADEPENGSDEAPGSEGQGDAGSEEPAGVPTEEPAEPTEERTEEPAEPTEESMEDSLEDPEPEADLNETIAPAPAGEETPEPSGSDQPAPDQSTEEPSAEDQSAPEQASPEPSQAAATGVPGPQELIDSVPWLAAARKATPAATDHQQGLQAGQQGRSNEPEMVEVPADLNMTVAPDLSGEDFTAASEADDADTVLSPSAAQQGAAESGPATPVPPPAAAQSATSAAAAEEDHDGETVMKSDLDLGGLSSGPEDTTGSEPAQPAPPPPTGPVVLARTCSQGHANPPTASNCGVCGQTLGGDAQQVRRPSLGRIRMSTGEVVELDRPAVIGRQPQAHRVGSGTMPRMIQVRSPNGDISRSHCEVILEGWHVQLKDLKATNGTLLIREGQSPRRLGQGESIMILDGDIADLGDGISLRFEGLL